MNVIDTNDRLVLFGYGVFETLRIEEKHIEVPKLHYKRMLNGANVLGLTLPEYTIWLEWLKEIVEGVHNQATYALRLTLSGGDSRKFLTPQLFHSIRSIPYTKADYIQGVNIYYLSSPRNENSPIIHIKSTNAIENLLGKKEAERKGAREGLWLNTKGQLTEGTVSNLFFVKDGVLCTPALDCGILPGTRRLIVLECARKLEIPIHEGQFSPSDLEKAEEVFLTNALMGLLPVKQIGNFKIPFEVRNAHSIKTRLEKSFKEYILNQSDY